MSIAVVAHPVPVTHAPMAHTLAVPRAIIGTVGNGEHRLETFQYVVRVTVQEDQHLRIEGESYFLDECIGIEPLMNHMTMISQIELRRWFSMIVLGALDRGSSIDNEKTRVLSQ